MLSETARILRHSLTLGVMIGAGFCVVDASPAHAQGTALPSATPPSLTSSVRAAVATAQKTDNPAAGTGADVSVSAGGARVEIKNNSSAEAKTIKATATGIELSDVPPMSEELARQLELERQAEEVAARAAEDAKREQEHNKKSFRRASEGLMPLSPEQIRDFMKKLEATQEAALAPSSGPPKGEVKVASVSLEPGAEPPQINLAAGYVTTISIIDQTGEPWPILDVGVGGNFEVTPTQAGSHVVRVVPLTRVGTGNLSILLKGLATPIIFRLSSGQEKFHLRFDARVPSVGPNARTPLIQRRAKGLVAGDNLISMILENAPPPEAKRLKVGGVDARTMAWMVGDRVYVRTPLSLLSPAWNASASSSDGMTVYEIGNAPVLLMSDNGAMVRARLLREDKP